MKISTKKVYEQLKCCNKKGEKRTSETATVRIHSLLTEPKKRREKRAVN